MTTDSTIQTAAEKAMQKSAAAVPVAPAKPQAKLAKHADKNLAKELEHLSAAQEANHANFLAQREELRARSLAISEILGPLDQLLAKRQGVLDVLATASRDREALVLARAEWTEFLDTLFRGGQVAMSYINACENRPVPANASRIIPELDAFVARRQADLAAVETEIREYAAQHSLEYRLPADMGGTALE